MARIFGNLLIGFFVVLVLALVSSTFLITPDLLRHDVIAKYRSETSFLYELPSGAQAHIRDEGNQQGPPLLLIHGSNASLHTWEPWVRELGADYRLISFDLPGHGLTGATPEDEYTVEAMSRFTGEIADLFGLDKVFLAGNSMGGAVALQFALDNPQRVAALIPVSSAGMTQDPDEASVGAFNLVGSSFGRMMMRYVTPRFVLASTLRGVVADPDTFVTEEMVERCWETLRMTGSRDATIKRFAGYPSRASLEPQLSKIKVPTLLLWGQQDPLIKVKYGIRMNAAISRSHLIIYPQAGHLAHEEIPVKTAADAHRFLQDVLGN